MRIGIIGQGAIGRFVADGMKQRGHHLSAWLVRPERIAAYRPDGANAISVAAVEDLPEDIEHVVDCAGHSALKAYGADILRRGLDLTTVSIGALADSTLEAELAAAAKAGSSRLLLASGAIGALDCLRAARVGKLDRVTYIGRKPPRGWRGSPAEKALDLAELTERAIHFEGAAREAAQQYPKNANVAAAVALAGIGFDQTTVQLVADPSIDENIHEVHASGDFGRFSFEIRGRSLPDNPRSSALAAMSVISTLEQERNSIRF